MANCDFFIEKAYKPEEDLILFFFLDEKTPIFDKEKLPQELKDIEPSSEQGKSKTAFCGILDGKPFISKAVRLDDKNLSPREVMKKSISSAISQAKDEGLKRVIVFIKKEYQDLLETAQEGAILGGYKFDKYLEKKWEPPAVVAVYDGAMTKKLKEILKEKKTLFSWVNFARDILNEPPNEVHPESLAEIFKKEGKRAGLKITVWDEKRLLKEKCGGILAVGKGASKKPKLVIGEYKPRRPKAFLALVGKGVTMDTGGYCLKPPKSQMGMKYDMGGAAMTFSAACAIAELKLPYHILVLTPLVENDISSSSFHTQDIIKMRNGKTVQVDNTDAEGRLILGDALTLASEKRPDFIIDAATLTGACVVALGEDIAGLFSRDEGLSSKIQEVAKRADEYLWPLPLHMPYMEQLKAEIADLKNIGSRWGGAITAALFLQNFVDEDIPWAHIDIAGPSVKEEPLGFLGKGAKGFGVKTLFELVKAL